MPGTSKLSHEERAERRKKIALAVKRHGDIAKASTDFKVTEHLVRNACKEHKVKVPRTFAESINASTYKVIAALINTTDTLTAIAIRHGLSPQRVDQIKTQCVEAGIKLKSRYRGARRRSA